MKISRLVLPFLALAALASCGGNTPASSATSEESSQAPSSQALPTFENYTLSQLHDARVAKTLESLRGKYVAVKGQVTFAKRFNEDRAALTIQNGKFAVEVTYPSEFTVNVGDAVEVKGVFVGDKVGDVDTIWISTYRSTVPNSDIKVINESISVETVRIVKEADLYEYETSKSTIAFTVTGNRNNAAFLGQLTEGETEFIVANRIDVAEKFPEAPYVKGDKVKYDGVFSYSGNESAKVIRYFDREGFSKDN